MPELFFIPVMLFLGLGIFGTIVSDHKEARKKRDSEERRKFLAESAARAKVVRSARKAAEKSAIAAKVKTEQPKRKRGRPRKNPPKQENTSAPLPVDWPAENEIISLEQFVNLVKNGQ